MPDVAPPFIPDTIPEVVETPPPPPVAEVVGVEGGVPAGVEGGEVGGVIGGIVDAVPVEKQPEPEIIQVQRDLPLPLTAIRQEYPIYPEYARTRGWEDSLVVRYVIGKDGKVKEVTVLKPPNRDEFAYETLKAIRFWRFHPFIGENGQPKEVVHELTVNFKVVRTAGR